MKKYSHQKLHQKLVESRVLGELGVVKLLASHFLRSLPGYKQCNLLSCI